MAKPSNSSWVVTTFGAAAPAFWGDSPGGGLLRTMESILCFTHSSSAFATTGFQNSRTFSVIIRVSMFATARRMKSRDGSRSRLSSVTRRFCLCFLSANVLISCELY